jgi:hypothetical protein
MPHLFATTLMRYDSTVFPMYYNFIFLLNVLDFVIVDNQRYIYVHKYACIIGGIGKYIVLVSH